jgi:GTPase SAR1 family protein
MNHSISTMSGKTKLKIILLGNQNVGKTCIIDKYINDRFEETANVPLANPANRRHRLPGQESHPQRQSLPPSAVGYSGTGAL